MLASTPSDWLTHASCLLPAQRIGIILSEGNTYRLELIEILALFKGLRLANAGIWQVSP